jgi:hypothetical protein
VAQDWVGMDDGDRDCGPEERSSAAGRTFCAEVGSTFLGAPAVLVGYTPLSPRTCIRTVSRDLRLSDQRGAQILS